MMQFEKHQKKAISYADFDKTIRLTKGLYTKFNENPKEEESESPEPQNEVRTLSKKRSAASLARLTKHTKSSCQKPVFVKANEDGY